MRAHTHPHPHTHTHTHTYKYTHQRLLRVTFFSHLYYGVNKGRQVSLRCLYLSLISLISYRMLKPLTPVTTPALPPTLPQLPSASTFLMVSGSGDGGDGGESNDYEVKYNCQGFKCNFLVFLLDVVRLWMWCGWCRRGSEAGGRQVGGRCEAGVRQLWGRWEAGKVSQVCSVFLSLLFFLSLYDQETSQYINKIL